jgi:hypothetical protein
MNGRNLRRTASRIFAPLQKIWRCERMQREIDRCGVGSLPTLGIAQHLRMIDRAASAGTVPQPTSIALLNAVSQLSLCCRSRTPQHFGSLE